MELVSIILAIVAIGIITIVTILLKSKILLHKVGETNSALTKSLESHNNVITNLPALISQNVSKEIRDGIEPTQEKLENLSKEVSVSTRNLIQSLSESHNTLVKTLTTINTDGSLTEWVESLKETIEPLQATTSALEEHYNTSEKLLDKTGELVIQWTTQRQVVENAFIKFASIIEEWAVKEATHLRDIEPRIMERLKEVASTNASVANGLSQLQSSQTKMIGAQQELSESVRTVCEKLLEIIDAVRLNQTGHEQLIRNQESLQDQLKTFQIEIQRRAIQFETQTDEMLKNLKDAQENFIIESQTNYKYMADIVDKFHEWHKEKLESITIQHESMIDHQKEFLIKNKELIARIENIICDLPSRKTVNIGLILFVINMLITGVIAYGILSR